MICCKRKINLTQSIEKSSERLDIFLAQLDQEDLPPEKVAEIYRLALPVVERIDRYCNSCPPAKLPPNFPDYKAKKVALEAKFLPYKTALPSSNEIALKRAAKLSMGVVYSAKALAHVAGHAMPLTAAWRLGNVVQMASSAILLSQKIDRFALQKAEKNPAAEEKIKKIALLAKRYLQGSVAASLLYDAYMKGVGAPFDESWPIVGKALLRPVFAAISLAARSVADHPYAALGVGAVVVYLAYNGELTKRRRK